MLLPSMNNLAKKISNQYLLVNIASQRARDIANEYNSSLLLKKSVQTALEDIANGKIEIQNR